MIRVGILGATGYTALELIKILLRHPEAEIVALTSRQEGNPHVAAIHPQLAGRLDMQLENLEPARWPPAAIACSAACRTARRPKSCASCWTPANAWSISAPIIA